MGHPISLTPQLDKETEDIQNNSGNLNYLKIDYRPTVTLYAKRSDLNVVDEYADAVYAHQFGKLTLSLAQNYQKLSQPTIEDTAAGQLVLRDIYTTTLLASYIYSDKLSTYAPPTRSSANYQSKLFTNSTEWNADYYFLYQVFRSSASALVRKSGTSTFPRRRARPTSRASSTSSTRPRGS